MQRALKFSAVLQENFSNEDMRSLNLKFLISPRRPGRCCAASTKFWPRSFRHANSLFSREKFSRTWEQHPPSAPAQIRFSSPGSSKIRGQGKASVVPRPYARWGHLQRQNEIKKTTFTISIRPSGLPPAVISKKTVGLDIFASEISRVVLFEFVCESLSGR